MQIKVSLLASCCLTAVHRKLLQANESLATQHFCPQWKFRQMLQPLLIHPQFHCIRHSSSRESSYTAHLLCCWWDCSPITNTLRWSYLPFPEVTRWKKKLGKDQPGPQFSLQFLHYSHHSKLLTFWNLKTFSPWAEIPS